MVSWNCWPHRTHVGSWASRSAYYKRGRRSCPRTARQILNPSKVVWTAPFITVIVSYHVVLLCLLPVTCFWLTEHRGLRHTHTRFISLSSTILYLCYTLELVFMGFVFSFKFSRDGLSSLAKPHHAKLAVFFATQRSKYSPHPMYRSARAMKKLNFNSFKSALRLFLTEINI